MALRLGLACAAMLACHLLAAADARAQNAWYEGFETTGATWRDAGGNTQYRLEFHDRVRGEAHTGDACERVALQAEPGNYVYLAHDVGSPLVIDELLTTVWVRSDRTGLQLLAQVVLPRSLDPKTGQPLTAIVEGARYTATGNWQQLRIEDIPRQLVRQVRVLRAQYGPSVDEREAYVGRVVLNVYGGPGLTTVWIDDLDVRGHVARSKSAEPRAGWTAVGQRNPPARTPGPDAAATPSSRVEIAGAVLTVDGRPFLPRMIQYQGEPLELLRRLGFNVVWLEQTATPEVLQEAERLGMWIVCPPPRPEGLDLPYGPVKPDGRIGPEFERVLAWNMGRGLSTPQLEATKRWADQVRTAGRAQSRPLIGQPDAELLVYSRYLDVLVLGGRPMGTSLELTDYDNWLRRRPALARPGTPLWTSVQTQLAPAVGAQLRALDPARPVPLALAPEQIRLLVYLAVANGAHGLLFESHAPLSAQDGDTQQRALALELVNLELSLIETWACAGTFLSNATSSAPEVRGALLRSDRARLVLPMWLGPGSQFVAGQAAANHVNLVLPGVPESNSAYELIPGALFPLRHKRTVGGVQVTVDEFGLATQILLANDPLIIGTLGRQATAIGARAAGLARELAQRKAAAVEQVGSELYKRGVRPTQTGDWFAKAKQHLKNCDWQWSARQYQPAWQEAQRATRPLRLIERACWDASQKGSPSTMSSPGLVSFATLPWHFRLADRMKGVSPGENRLPGGNFDDLGATVGSQWQTFKHGIAGVQTGADVVAQAAHSGRGGMQLSARAENPAQPPVLLESPPLWLVSPPVPVEAGDLVSIRAWVQIRPALTATLDGLLIFDSQTGEALAERIGQAAGWREVVLYRIAPRTGPLTVTFALTGLGQVFLDDVTVHVLPGPRNGIVIQPPQTTTATP